MSELIMIRRNAARTTSQAVTEQTLGEMNIYIENEAGIKADVIINDEAIDNISEGETETDTEAAEGLDEGGFTDEAGDGTMEDGAIIDTGISIIEGEYMDPGFYEEGYMEPGMETGMVEVKDPLLSSWPFVIGISAAVLLLSIALGALLARLKIKKGIELYED